jgi:hypothetical protein
MIVLYKKFVGHDVVMDITDYMILVPLSIDIIISWSATNSIRETLDK